MRLEISTWIYSTMAPAIILSPATLDFIYADRKFRHHAMDGLSELKMEPNCWTQTQMPH